MNPYLTLGLLVAIIVVPFVLGIWLLSWNRRVPVTGIDFGTGYIRRKKCKVNRHGGITYKHRDGRKIHLVLGEIEGSAVLSGDRGREFIADVSDGQGRLIALKKMPKDYRVLGLDGTRLWYALFAGGLKDIAESSKTDLNKTLMILMVGASVFLFAILGALAYIINMMQKANAATGGAGGLAVGAP